MFRKAVHRTVVLSRDSQELAVMSLRLSSTRPLLSAFVAVSVTTCANAAPATISPGEALKHLGRMEEVRGVVAQIGHDRSGLVFLDFGAPYPNETFTAVIFSDAVPQFPNVDRLEGRTISVRGTVELYHGRPEIVVRSPSQIRSLTQQR
jgi:DNA/RNA endonuclease YhcR with UshA esterase domain